MSENENHNSPAEVPKDAESFGMIPKASASFGNIPHASEVFRTVPHPSENFGSVLKSSEGDENHSLTVRDAAHLFEAAGVARTERSITNWCQPNRTGVARLDAYFDPNERKYFITPQSVELAIAEEKAKAAKVNEPPEPFGMLPQSAETFRIVPKATERIESSFPNDSETREIKELENQIRDLQITNKAKDIVIEQMQKDRNTFFEQVISANRKMGELQTKLLQLEEKGRLA